MTNPHERLRHFKRRYGLTNDQLGSMLGLPVYHGKTGPLCPQISRWLSGKHKPPAMLGLALDELERQHATRIESPT